MATKLFVNVQAGSIASALVRSPTNLSPVSFPSLVIGDQRDYEIYFVDGLGGYAPWSGDASYIPMLAIGDCGYPSGGTFTLTFGANTTTPLAYNASPAAVQTALQGLASIGSGNVLVSGTAGKYYVAEFTGTLAATNVSEILANFDGLTPAGTVEVSTLVVGGAGINEQQLLNLAINPITYADDWTPITNGWAGTLSVNTLGTVAAFAAAGGILNKTFQVTVQDPVGARTTFVKVAASIQCTIIGPESFAGTNKPQLVTLAQFNAAVFGTNNFSRESLTNTTGNSNITRTSTSRHHTAVVSVTGAASTRTLSLLTTNSPNAGDVIFLSIQPDATPANVIQVRNATSGGTLLETITTDASAQPFFVVAVYSGSAWGLVFSQDDVLNKTGNLAGMANAITSRANLRTVFSRVSSKSANFTVLSSEDGTLFPVSTAGGAVVATLPAHAAGLTVALQKSDGSANSLTTSPATITLLSANASAVLVSDGSSWVIATAYNPIDGGNALTIASNSTGNLTLTPVAPIQTVVMTLTGAASTRIFPIDVTGQAAGNILKIRFLFPATSGIAIELRNASAAGTVLYDFTTDGDNTATPGAYFELYFDGSAWQKLLNVIPVY